MQYLQFWATAEFNMTTELFVGTTKWFIPLLFTTLKTGKWRAYLRGRQYVSI